MASAEVPPDPSGTVTAGAGGAEDGPSPGRQLGLAVLLCVAGAGLAWYFITRTWTATLSSGQGRVDHPGSDSAPLVLALALVGLAGGGALLATRGLGRRILGALVVAAGAGVVAAAIAGWSSVPTGPASKATAYMIGCVAGGLLIAVGGQWALRRGHLWPAMGARYDRKVAATPAIDEDGTVDSRAAWDALDRGDDPTTGRPA